MLGYLFGCENGYTAVDLALNSFDLFMKPLNRNQ